MAAGSPSLAAMEEVLRLGQAIARHEQSLSQPSSPQQQVSASTSQKRSTPRQAPGGGLPRGPSSSYTSTNRGKSPASARGEPHRRGSADPYAFTDKVPPASVRGGGQRRKNQHEAFRNSPEEMAIRAKIKVLELKERRLDREEHQRLVGGISFRKAPGSSGKSASKSGRSVPANDISGMTDDYGRSSSTNTNDSHRHSTPQRYVGGGRTTPGSIGRLASGAVPGQAPRHSTTKQPKMVFGRKV